MTNPDSKALTVCLWLALTACAVMLGLSHVRFVNAEDDCAMGTWAVERTPAGLVCFVEPEVQP
jgi:hypothetical protein